MATQATPILVAKSKRDIVLYPHMANRHGLIAGATGTGKTVTLRVLAEQFSHLGVPVFMADVKGDLSGIARPGGDHPKVAERVKTLGLEGFQYQASPVVFWDVFGKAGHPIRATVSEMGPLLLSRILNLNEIQSGVLSLVFKVADDNGLLLLDLKDLRAMAQFVGDNADTFKVQYGNVSKASIGAIQRNLLALQEQGAESLFGEPALDFDDLMQTDAKGQGMINILAADKLMQSPTVYATFLLWLLSELFERLPEVGDLPKPKLVFFFDEAHLLFADAPKLLEEKIEQVVRLIRSKGVGRILRDPEPAGSARYRAGPARQPRPARAPGLHAPGPEGRQGRGRDLPRQSEAGHHEGDHRAGRGGGPGLDAGREGSADGGGAGLGDAAAEPPRAALPGRDRRPSSRGPSCTARTKKRSTGSRPTKSCGPRPSRPRWRPRRRGRPRSSRSRRRRSCLAPWPRARRTPSEARSADRSSGACWGPSSAEGGDRRLLKKAHLRRWPASPLTAAYLQYASLGHQRAALHLDLFEQP